MYAPQQLAQLLQNELQFMEAVNTTEKRLLEEEHERRMQQARQEAFAATQQLRAQQLALEQQMAQPLPAIPIASSTAAFPQLPAASLTSNEVNKPTSSKHRGAGTGAGTGTRDKLEAIADSDSDATLREGFSFEVTVLCFFL